MKQLLAACGVALTLAACNDLAGSSKSLSPIPPRTMALMSERGMTKSDPILVRLYKKESELEVWKQVGGRYAHLKTFPICRWSGQLGPKVKEGDRQAPEGFYSITPAQMNPNSSYYLSFDTGYPNAYDRANGRTGSYLMVHGTCSSRGCYAMTDEGISEIYALARESFGAGQKSFQFQAYPFRMTAENLAKYRQDPHIAYWRNLKQGSDHFEISGREPRVSVCERRYAFDAVDGACKDDPTIAPAVAQKDEEDRRQVAELVAKGVPAVRIVYADGGGHESFRSGSPFPSLDGGSALAILDSRPRRNLGEVSRPEALAEGPREVAVAEPAPKPAPGKPARASLAALASGGDVTRTGATSPKPGRTVLASADPDAPIPAPATDQPFYSRVMSNVFGRDEGAKPAPVTASAKAAGPAANTPGATPDGKHRQAALPAEKPDARAKSSDLPPRRPLPGSQPVGPAAGSFKAE